MLKLKDKLLVMLFLIFIFGMSVLFIFLPKSDFSVNEKRSLAELPEISISSVIGGSFESGTETYLTDHFPFKDNWTAINSYFLLYTGRNGVNGIYKCKDGYLVNTPLTEDDTDFIKNMSAVRSFCEKTDIPVSVIIVPTTGSIMSDKLPKNHAPYNDDEYINQAKALLADEVDFIDIRENLKNLVSQGEQVFYKTDHHWTSRGAYEAYCMYQGNPYDKDSFNIESFGDFFGTTYSKSALWKESGENIDLWTYPVNVKVTIKDGVSEKTSEDMFFKEHLNEADKYPVYLDGNHEFVRIENPDSDGEKVLLIKDSYAHCLAPFFALHNSITDMIDLRYYYNSVSELIKSEGYDKILIVYGLENLVEYTDISILE